MYTKFNLYLKNSKDQRLQKTWEKAEKNLFRFSSLFDILIFSFILLYHYFKYNT